MVLSVVLSIVLVFFLEVKAQQGVSPARDNRPEKLEVNDSLFPETD